MAQWDLTESYQRIGKNSGTFSYGGYSYTFVVRTYAKYSGNTIYFYLTITNESSAYWSGTNKHYYVNCNGAGITSLTKFTDTLAAGGVFTSSTYSTNVTPGTYYTLNGAEQVGDGTILATKTVSDSVRIPAAAPSGLSVTVKEIYTNGAKFGVSISSYGTPSSTSGRWIEAGIAGQNAWQSPSLRSAKVLNSTSSDITVNNSSTQTTTLTIQPNTQYYYGGYSTNTVLDTSRIVGTLVTLAPALSAKSASTASTTSITVSATTAADGGKYAKNIQYNIGNGWVTGATVAAGTTAATTKSFTISGLTPGTAYTINLRVNTSAGSTSSGSVSATTYKVPNTPTTSATNASATSNTVTYGTTGFNTPNSGTVYLYGGTAASPTTQLTTKTTTGNSNYTHSSLTGNTKYYYRSRAKNTGGWSSYSSDATAITRPAAPTLAVAIAGGQKQKKVTLTITSPSQGSAATMTAYYTVNGGSATSAGTVGSGSSVTANITTLPQTTYTIVAYLKNSSGNSSTVTKTITTGLPLYCRVSGSRKTVKKLYCSVSGQAKLVQHLYGSVNGQAKKIF